MGILRKIWVVFSWIVKILLLFLLTVFLYTMLDMSWVLWKPSYCKPSNQVYNDYYVSLYNKANILGTLYKLDKKFKLDKNICYSFMNYYMLNETEYIDITSMRNDFNCTVSMYESKLIKKWNNCFIYKLKIKNFLTKDEYSKVVYISRQIVWNYDSWKKCEKWDYEKCNMYITEKWVLKYNDSYKCE